MDVWLALVLTVGANAAQYVPDFSGAADTARRDKARIGGGNDRGDRQRDGAGRHLQ
jgi:hypothetical protein